MLRMLPELAIGPLLVGGSTLVGRRWGSRISGVVSAFPAVVGPVLLIVATQRGAASAGHAASGTLLGLVALSAFVVTYARVAILAGWRICLLSGWICAAGISLLAGWLIQDPGPGGGLAAAVVSLLCAHRAMPRSRTDLEPGRIARTGIVARMAVTGLLVAVLTAVGALVSPLVAGMLAALPVLASVLAVFTHRREGFAALVALLRGMLIGMIGFVGFCAVVAWLIVPAGTAWAFAVASVTAIGLQLLAVLPRPRWALLRRLQPA